MDLKIHRPRGACGVTGRPFTPGELFHSALIRGAAGLERLDVCAEAWSGPPATAVAAWRSTFPAAATAAPSLAPVDVLLDVLEDFAGHGDDASLRYLLALELVRRRVLRVSEPPPDEAATDLVLVCRRRDREYRVPVAVPEATATATLNARLSALLWSGDAA